VGDSGWRLRRCRDALASYPVYCPSHDLQVVGCASLVSSVLSFTRPAGCRLRESRDEHLPWDLNEYRKEFLRQIEVNLSQSITHLSHWYQRSYLCQCQIDLPVLSVFIENICLVKFIKTAVFAFYASIIFEFDIYKLHYTLEILILCIVFDIMRVVSLWNGLHFL